ncbi:hypothetical protein [Streptomyces sp. CAU 1734]|uniref:hypothetical protein n=1 Tax=Streptomyces sp. CAU 1734 TaxID=3140360 RepID=UPI0032615800
MWPGQQPPGGDNPQQDPQQNPYQQPGYHQPNPYQQPDWSQTGRQPGQQPGWSQPNPYSQPTVSAYPVPPHQGGPAAGPGGGPPPGNERRKTAVVAIAAATAVIAAAVVTGAVVLREEDGAKGTRDTGKGTGASGSGTATAPSTPAGAPAPTGGNPRNAAEAEPTIAGWKVVTNPRHGTRFDVPPAWEIVGSGVSTFLENEKDPAGPPLVTMSAPARFTSRWCEADTDKDGRKETWGLATVGTKGGQGAKDSASASRNEAGTWVWGAYAQSDPKEKVKLGKPEPYTTASGLTGSVTTATAAGVTKKSKCHTDGKSIAFTFKDRTGDFRTWVLYGVKGVKGEVPDKTVRQILNTVRLTDTPAD